MGFQRGTLLKGYVFLWPNFVHYGSLVRGYMYPAGFSHLGAVCNRCVHYGSLVRGSMYPAGFSHLGAAMCIFTADRLCSGLCTMQVAIPTHKRYHSLSPPPHDHRTTRDIFNAKHRQMSWSHTFDLQTSPQPRALWTRNTILGT